MAIARRAPLKLEDLPPDAKAHVDALPAWLREVAAAGFAATSDTDGVKKLERERAETDRLTRHTQMVDRVVFALRGGLGKSKDAKECVEALTRVLAGQQPRTAETATLVVCESIIRETKERIRKVKAPPPAGRGAP